MIYLASIEFEAAVVAVVCIPFLMLFAFVGIQGLRKNKD
jgi:hypothetical protein